MESKVPGLNETEEETTSVGTSAQPQAPVVSESAEVISPESSDESQVPDLVDVDAAVSGDVPVSEGTAVTAEEPPAVSDAGAVGTTGPQRGDVPVSEGTATTVEEPPAPGATGPQRGDVVEGVVIATSPTSVTVEVNGVEGIIPSTELEKMSRNMLTSLKEGEHVTVYVVNPHGHGGKAVLSVNRALEELDWQEAEQYRQSQDVYETRVAGYNKGGLIVRFGRVRGFVPQSQMSADRRRTMAGETPEERWGKMVNEPIAVKVMEVDRARNRLILSERLASRESREKRKESLISQLEVGEVRTGRVVSLEDFGAFVDIGGAEGLVHLTELSWKHVTHPRELLKVGQEVTVEVISIDPDAKRIGLSMKRQEADPWDTVAINYNVGQLVQAVVTKLTKFGAFARLVDVPEIEGLIHISELSDKRVNHPREVVEEGDKLTLRVVKMDIKNRRLGLSLKKVNSAEYLDQDWSSYSGGDVEASEPETQAVAEPAVQEIVEPAAQDVTEPVVQEIVEPEAQEVTEPEPPPVEPDSE